MTTPAPNLEDFTNNAAPFSEVDYWIDFNLGESLPIYVQETSHVTYHGVSDLPRRSSERSWNENVDDRVSGSGSSSAGALIRKGHTKSRRGCHNCKRRRVKCPENRPTCTQCTRRGLNCSWPEIQIVQSNGVTTWSPSIPKPLASQDSTFTMEDFRLFNHFIQNCYPHHPIGNDSVWQHEIPSIAHNYDFLLHSMMALSASDLSHDGADIALSTSAMSHRLKAISSLNRALSSPNLTSESSNAMLASCYALVFQSVLICDGLAEYMTFIRGCVLIMFQMGARNLKFIFHTFLGEDVVRKIDPDLERMPHTELEAAGKALRSLEAFAGLCKKELEREFHGHLVHTVRGLFSSPKEAYMALQNIYGLFSWKMSHADFQSFIDPSNDVAQLLQSHFVAVQTLLSPITVAERGGRPKEEPNGTVRWLGTIHRNVKPEMRRYCEWPMERAEEVSKSRRAVVDKDSETFSNLLR